MGIGAHPDLRVAASRALTEAAQSRCGDIQGVREDLEQADGTSVSGHTRRVAFIDRRRWILGRSTSLQPWRDVPDCRHKDIVDDIRLILARLRAAGIQQAVMVDFSPPDSGVVVLRAVIPGLETWVVDHGRLGERAASQVRHASVRAADA
jgi:ribosomal protein S12 methylthiotransferase accessory factor